MGDDEMRPGQFPARRRQHGPVPRDPAVQEHADEAAGRHVFSYFIRNTAFAITNEQSRFTLSGAKFIIGDGTAKMITTDGHRLAYVETRDRRQRRRDGYAHPEKGSARARQALSR